MVIWRNWKVLTHYAYAGPTPSEGGLRLAKVGSQGFSPCGLPDGVGPVKVYVNGYPTGTKPARIN